MDTIVIAVLILALMAVALMLSRALMGTRLAMKRFRVLTEIAEVSDAGGTLEDLLGSIGDILVPVTADICMIDMISPDGVKRAVVRVAPGGAPEVEHVLARREPSLPDEMNSSHPSSAAPKLRFFERMSEDDLRDIARDENDLRFLSSLHVRSAITVALRARGRLTGAITLITAWSGRGFGPEDAQFARVLAGRVALALDNAGLFADLERVERARAEIAETLQRGLLPPPLPHIPGWSTAAMYRPAGTENEVGGDFYDAFPIQEGWMVVIGDVTGRGARAASITAQARYTLRTAGALGGDPLVALSALNRALLARGDSALCSVAAFALPVDSREAVRIAVAGHPPPLLVDGKAVSETVAAGPVLGAFAGARWTIEEIVLEKGQQFIVITDGITEAAGPAGRFGEERLRAEIASVASPATAVQKLEGAVHAFTEGRFEDDAAILAIAPAPIATGIEPGVSVDSLFPPPPAMPASGGLDG